jgi:hypothetical protein
MGAAIFPPQLGNEEKQDLKMCDPAVSEQSLGTIFNRSLEPVSKPFHNNFQLARHLHEC